MNWEAVFNFVFTWGSGFVVGWWLAGRASQEAMKRILENAGVTQSQLKQAALNMGMDPEQVEEHFEEDDQVIHIRIEKHGKQFLVYQMETDQFLTQATTAKKVISNLKNLNPTTAVTYNIAPEDGLKYIEKELDKLAN